MAKVVHVPEIMLSGWRKENLFCLLMQIILSNPV